MESDKGDIKEVESKEGNDSGKGKNSSNIDQESPAVAVAVPSSISATGTESGSLQTDDGPVDSRTVTQSEESSPNSRIELNLSKKPTSDDSDVGFKRPMIGPIFKPPGKWNVSSDGEHTSATGSASNSSSKDGKKNSQSDTDDVLTQEEGEQESESIGDKEPKEESIENVQDTGEQSTIKEKLEQVSPAQQAKLNQIALPYLEPKWSGRSDQKYYFEVLKNGKIIDKVELDKTFYVFGRLPQCDVTMEHPSLSRYHAIIQHCGVVNDRHEIGWYLYDLESTHGTYINKNQVKSRVYYRLKVGYVVKFGGSSRLHILQGPPEDEEEESDMTITELKAQKELKKTEKDLLEGLENNDDEEEDQSKGTEDEGCSWGMGEEAKEPELEINFADAIPQHEELYLDDPKKALKGYFEREGYDLPEYQFEEGGHGKHKCIVEVPVDSPSGQPVYAEATVSGKRKDAVIACALEACRILDRYGLLRKKDHEAKKAKTRDWEANDYYGSDEDEFLDRTGEIQRKRERRMKRAGKVTETPETYESLSEKLTKVITEMDEVNTQLEKARKVMSQIEGDGLDALDAYMSSIKKGAVDTKTKMALKRRMFDLKKERGRLERLVNIARPALMPTTTTSKPRISTTSMVGKIKGFTMKIPKDPIKLTSAIPAPVSTPKPLEEPNEEQQKNIEVTGKKDPVVTKTVDTVTTDTNKPEPSRTDAPATSTDLPENPKPTKEVKSRQPAKRKTDSLEQTIKRLKVKEGVKEQQLSKEYCDNDPDYAVWVPPKGQTGDGTTHLNAKYGY